MEQAISDEHGHGPGLVAEHYTSTGLDSRKLLMWTFLGSECLFFGSLISTYMVYRGKSLEGPYPNEILNIPFTSVSAFVLLMSSFAMVLGVSAAQRGNQRSLRIWLVATALLGMVFLGGQIYEFTTFVHEGLTLSKNLFGATFFILTGFHGAHVTIGVFWLLSTALWSATGRLTQKNAIYVDIMGLYWHFVDIVWIVIFALVYLIPVQTPHGG